MMKKKGSGSSSPQPIRIMHLITDSGIGGAEKIMAELVSRLDPEQFTCRVVVMKEPGAIAEKLIERGFQVDSLHLPAGVRRSYFFSAIPALVRLIRLIRAFRPEILHCWLFQANLMGRVAARLTRVPVNLSGLRVIEMEHMNQYLPDRLTRGLVTRYLAVCEAVAKHYQERLGISSERITVIPNGIAPVTGPAPDREAMRRELGVPEGHRVIGFLGRLHPQKGVDLLLEAFTDVVLYYPRTMLLIAGKGPARESLIQKTERRRIEDQVKFLGEWPDPATFFEALDLLVLPSRWEGLPNVVLEAMAHGRPVVATWVGGTQELVAFGAANKPNPEETGILVEPGNAPDLARAIMAVLANPMRAEAMGRRARTRVRAEFSIEVMIKKYIELYQQLVRPGERK